MTFFITHYPEFEESILTHNRTTAKPQPTDRNYICRNRKADRSRKIEKPTDPAKPQHKSAGGRTSMIFGSHHLTVSTS